MLARKLHPPTGAALAAFALAAAALGGCQRTPGPANVAVNTAPPGGGAVDHTVQDVGSPPSLAAPRGAPAGRPER